jgi:NAD(P)-dependent dehydrogenase (short-subunit alcohol dehydrogenase family)
MEKVMNLPETPSFRLDGKRALVTGAGRGIGLGCANALASAGAEVVLCARTADEIEAGAAAIRADGHKAEALTLDVTQYAEAGARIAAAGPFDILVNNAGTNRPKPFVDVSVDDYDTVLDLNLKAAFFVAQAVAKGMVAAGRGGSIIQMSSQLAKVGSAGRTLYCASKWAIEGLTKAMALDLAPHGVRVNTVCPTFIETALTKPYLADAAFRQNVLSKIKLGRLGRVEDLLGGVVFLASDASSLMTGTSLVIDGGWTAE